MVRISKALTTTNNKPVTKDEFDDEMTDTIMLVFVITMTLMMIMPTVMRTVASSVSAQQLSGLSIYEGRFVEKPLYAISTSRQFDILSEDPYIPWISAEFYNDGSNIAYISINVSDSWITIHPMGMISIDLSSSYASIETVYYKSGPNSTVIRAVGRY